jgi:hypothetical protein
MANPEHVAKLLKGAEKWNARRAQNPAVGIPDLSRANLGKADLSNANLSRADLSGADLSDAHLALAHLAGASVSGANLRGADLSYAHLADADLAGSDLADANLARADLRRATLDGIVFADLDLRDVNGLEEVTHSGPTTIGIDKIYRSQGRIPEGFLRGAGVPEPFIVQMKPLVCALDPVRFYSCFISYSHADQAFARALHDTLQGHGIRCWLDEKKLLPGDEIYEHLDRDIRLSDKILLCCSEHSLQPVSWVDMEIITTLEKEDELTRTRGEKVRAMIPLNLDGYIFGDRWSSGYRAEIRRRLAPDFTGWAANRATFDAATERVIMALRADAAARE